VKMNNLLATVIALAVGEYAGIASAADRLCLPDEVCCAVVGSFPGGRPDRRCGTLEEFQRYARIVCLKGDAIENKNLPEAIEASSRCIAAKIAATRVEETQRSNAAAHQRALDAQQQLREMEVKPPAAASISASAAKPPVAGTCFQSECYREYIVDRVRADSGLVLIRTRVEHYCNPGYHPNGCPPESRAPDGEASYTVQCKSPGGYIQYQNVRTQMPKPFVSHVEATAAQLWVAVCHQPYPQGWPPPQ
jgi:hypothetical protein